MALSLAIRSSGRAKNAAAPTAFATLIGPVDATRRRTNAHTDAASGEKHLLATVAHELRNPLASLRLSLDLLVSDFHVQSLVQQQGGRVGVESAVRQGATFWFTLPAAEAAPSGTANPCLR